MYYKLKTIFLSHFLLRILLNLTVTGYFAFLFFLKGFDKYPLYMLALLFKFIGYFISQYGRDSTLSKDWQVM